MTLFLNSGETLAPQAIWLQWVKRYAEPFFHRVRQMDAVALSGLNENRFRMTPEVPPDFAAVVTRGKNSMCETNLGDYLDFTKYLLALLRSSNGT